jgi:transposase-like protein
MYSYEDRIRAVELYIKCEKRTMSVIRQLGYPTKNALKAWYREFVQDNDLTAGYVRTTAKYSLDQKKVVVDHDLGFGRCLTATAKALGYPYRRTLLAWVVELYPEFSRRVVGKAGRSPLPTESRHAAVIELCTREESARIIAQKVGVSRHTLYKWKDQLLGREVPASMKRPADPPHAPDCEELERQVETLRRDIRQLQLEHDILTKANELLKKGQGIDLQLLSNREKTLLVDALRSIYALPELLVEIGLVTCPQY